MLRCHFNTKGLFVTILEILIQKQTQINIQSAGSDWANKKLDWDTAILVEIGELIDSLHWKWWKNQTNNLLNAQVEAIDILHFALSRYIESNPDEHNLAALEKVIHDTFPMSAPTDTIIKQCKKLVIETLTQEPPAVIILGVIQIAAGLGLTLEQVLNLYIGKNVLNKFRQDNGYHTGEYQKIWNHKEDNFYMYMFAVNKNYSDNFENELEEYLSLTYNKSEANTND